MGTISAFTILISISGLLLSDHCVNGQTTSADVASSGPKELGSWTFDTTTTAGVVLGNSDACPSYVQADISICSTYTGLNDLGNLLESPDFDVCSNTLLQYACANVNNLPESTAFNILNCILTDPHAVVTQGAYSLFFSRFTLNTIGSILNRINRLVPASSIPARNKQYVLNAVWEQLRQDPENLTPGALAAWIQEKLYAFIPAINTEILNCIITTTVTCDGLEAIVRGLDMQYSVFSVESRAEIGMWITRFISSHSCSKDTLEDSIKTFYLEFKNDMNIDDFKLAFGDQSLSSALSIFSEIQVQQYVVSTNAFSSYESSSVVLNLLDTNDITYNFAFLNSLPVSDYSVDVLYSLLNNLLDKLNSITDPLCKPQLKTIFQGKLSYLLVAANETILEKLAPNDCSAFQDIYQGFDKVYNKLSDEVKSQVFKYRTQFLNDEAAKSGSACTYGFTSSTWLVNNYGRSVEFESYANLIRLNEHFDGYEAISYLNTQQIIDLLIHTEIFTSASPSDIETRVTSVTNALSSKGYVNLKLFLIELKTVMIKFNIKIIVNFQVRFLFLNGIWGVLKTQFSQFTANDWLSLTQSLSYFSSAISTTQLSDLSIDVIEDCSNLRTLVNGFGSSNSDMSDNSKSGVTDWISNVLRNETSHCIDGDGDWLVKSYGEFRTNVDITTIISINPEYNLAGSIEILAANQLGQFVMVDSETRTNVTLVETVFSVLTSDAEKAEENLANFWSAFTTSYEKVYGKKVKRKTVQISKKRRRRSLKQSENFSVEVKHVMLYSTVKELSSSFINYTAEETTLWFETRMYPVMSVIDSEVLSEISFDVGCGFQSSFVNALSFVYTDTAETNKADVLNYIQKYLQYDQQEKPEADKCTTQDISTITYITSYFGDYSVDTSYEQLTTYFTNFNVFDNGVFQILTSEQFGDMIEQEKVYESVEKVEKVFQYLETQTIDVVDAVMTRFSNTGYEKNIQIQDTTIGQKILENYLNIIKTKVTTYTTTEIKLLLEIRIKIVIQFFTVQTLSIFAVRDCDTLVVIVVALDNGFGKMSDSTRAAIASWILSTLKSSSLKGCTSTSTTTTEWVNNTFKQFFKYTTLKEVKEVNSQLDTLEIIKEITISQKAEYICSSNALTDVTVTTTVLDSLKGEGNIISSQEVFTFLSEFNTAYSKLNVQTMTTEVKEQFATTLFTSYTADFNSLTVDQISAFSETFQYVIPGFTDELVQKIPINMNCDAYKSIYGGISSAYSDLSDNTKEAVFKQILSYLDHNDKTSTSVCSSLYTDSKSYVETIFLQFSSLATVYDFQQYYTEFNAYSCLDILTGTQLGNLLVNTTAITNQLDAAQILVEVNKRDYSEVKAFLTEVNLVAEEKHLTKLPDVNIQNLIFQTVWSTVTKNVKTSEDYKEWFGGELNLIISSSSVSDIASLSSDIDCSSQSYVVQSFSNVFSNLNDDQKSAMFGKIKKFGQGVKDSTGSACPTDSEDSGSWVETYLGKFSVLASVADFKELNDNFKPVDALNVLTGSQVADYTIESGALKSVEAITPVLESIDTTEKAKSFLLQCNSVASEELQNSPAAKEILDKTFEVLTTEIKSFQTTDWQEWTQVILKNILQNVNEINLEIINFPLNCASYQALITGLNNVFDIMTENSRTAVYEKCIKPQFNSLQTASGIKCGQKNDNIEVWVQTNFAKFSVYIEITEYESWNYEYKATSVISTLSPDQLAVVAVTAVNNEDVACQVAAKVQEFDVTEVDGFLDKLSASLKQNNIKTISNVSGYKFLSSSLSVISGALSTYTSSQWTDLISSKLQPFIFSIDTTQLTTLLAYADCSSYKTILQQLNNNYDNFSPENRQGLFGVLYDFINKKTTSSGFCPESGKDSSTAITQSIGKFSSFLTYDQFKQIVVNFNWEASVDLLSNTHLADAIFIENIFSDQGKADVLSGRLASLSFTDIDAFLHSFQVSAGARAITSIPGGAIQKSIFNAIFSKVSAQFGSFSDSQWNDYFGSLFSWFYTSLEASQVELIPETISCTAFQSVVSGTSKFYGQLQADVQTALYAKIKSFLQKRVLSSGTACPISGNSGDWLVQNIGALRVKAPIADILTLNPNFIFTDAVSYLTPEQLGSYAANNNVLSDKDKIAKVLSVLNSQNIGLFLDAFNAAAAANGISSINNAAVKTFFLREIFCKAGSGFTSFTSDNYADFFHNKLQMFTSSLDAKAFGFIPTDIGCDSLASIMKPLFDVQTLENPTAVFDFVYSILSAKKSSTGYACTGGDFNSRQWVLKFFGQYLQAGEWSSFITLVSNFDVAECADLLSSTQLAEASSGVTIIHNITVISTVMATIGGDISSLSTFIDTLRQYVILNPDLLTSSKVKDVVLAAVAQTVLVEFNTLSVTEVQNWMNKISFLLPSFNETILEYIPLTTECPQFQTFVYSMDSVFNSLTLAKKQAVANFIETFLSNKASKGEDPCTSGTSTTIQWTQKNIASYCGLLSADAIAAINTNLDKVSYQSFCSFSD